MEIVMMLKNNKKVILIIISIILIISIAGLSLSYAIKKQGIYSIGIIYKTDYAGRAGGIRYYYYYFYKNKKYFTSSINHTTIKLEDINSRVFIQFLPFFPCYDIVLPNIRVPDSITEAPYEGWKELPIPVQE